MKITEHKKVTKNGIEKLKNADKDPETFLGHFFKFYGMITDAQCLSSPMPTQKLDDNTIYLCFIIFKTIVQERQFIAIYYLKLSYRIY